MSDGLLYKEKHSFGNKYRNTYYCGLEDVLFRLQEQACLRRKEHREEIRRDPEGFRERIRKTLGWPLTEPSGKYAEVTKQFVARDDMADIFRLQLQILPNVWMYGILFLQHTTQARPLVISQHGGMGTPEKCSSFFDSANYNDMTRRILQKGVHVFCPQLLLWDTELFGDKPFDRRRLDDELKRVGSSVVAIEISGLQQYLNYFDTLPYIQSERIGMIGLSYGGFYTMLLSALDTRIKASMTACFFNDARTHSTFSDCAWAGSENCFQDAEIAALVYPRSLWIDVADQDEVFPSKSACAEFECLQEIRSDWENLHFRIFQGTHEFPLDDDGIDFVINAL